MTEKEAILLKEIRETVEKLNLLTKMLEDEKKKIVFKEVDFPKQKITEKEISDFLKSIGIPTNILGFKYLKTAIVIVLENPFATLVTKEIYPEIAKKYKTRSSCVERNIRTAIKHFFDNADSEIYDKLFRKSRTKMPSNSEFISTVVDYISSI